MEQAVFGGGCFWCTEAVFKELRGVQRVEPGYAGGDVADPGYEAVCSGTTGHAEVVRVTYDPAEIGYEDLLRIHFGTHDPTTLNRQGPDAGTQYRSAIYPADEAQLAAARRVCEEVAPLFGGRITTEITPLARFWPAEGYHHDYYARNGGQPYCRAIIAPKVAKLRKQYAQRLKAAR